MANKAAFKTENPFIQFICLSKIPVPQGAPVIAQEGKGSSPVTPHPSQPTPFPPKSHLHLSIPSPPHLMKAVQAHSWRRFLWKIWGMVSGMEQEVFWWELQQEMLLTFCCGMTAGFPLFPRPSLPYKPSWKPSPWHFTPNYPKGKTRQCQIVMLKNKIKSSEKQVIQKPSKQLHSLLFSPLSQIPSPEAAPGYICVFLGVQVTPVFD